MIKSLIGSVLIASALVFLGIKISNSLNSLNPSFEGISIVEIQTKTTSGTWTIPIEGRGKTISEAKITIESSKNLLKKFLVDAGFNEKEISSDYPDLIEQNISNGSNVFHVTSFVKITTNQVEKLYQQAKLWGSLTELNIKVKEFTKPIFYLDSIKDFENQSVGTLFKEAYLDIKEKSKSVGFEVIRPRYHYFSCTVKSINGPIEGKYMDFHSPDLSFETPYICLRNKLHLSFEVKYLR